MALGKRAREHFKEKEEGGFEVNEIEKKYYRRKTTPVTAFQWKEVSPYVEGELRIVRYFRRPDIKGSDKCPACDCLFNDHGWIDSGGDGRTVCPNDYVICILGNGYYPCSPKFFKMIYEEIQ